MAKKVITTEELKLLQIRILDKVKEFCYNKNIRMSLGFGTLLGAVRHKGYIPWDDDIDILMPYPDYKRFLREFACRDSNLAVQYMGNDEKYRFHFAKVDNNRTILVEKAIITGAYIDIFHIIGFPKKEEFKDFVYEFRSLYGLLRKMTFRYNLNDLQQFWIKIKQIYKPSREQIVQSIENMYGIYPFDKAEFGGVIPYNFSFNTHFPADIFRKYTDIPFEGKQYPVIENYNAFLRWNYGN